MFCYDGIDISEGIDVNYLLVCFLNYIFKFQPNVCNRCHDLLMISINLIDIAILNIKDSDYHCIISLISKNEAINLMQNADLTKKSKTL